MNFVLTFVFSDDILSLFSNWNVFVRTVLYPGLCFSQVI